MNHLQVQLKTPLSRFAALAVVCLSACGGSNQSQANTPQSTQAYPSSSDQYGSAMGQPQTNGMNQPGMSGGTPQQNSMNGGTGSYESQSGGSPGSAPGTSPGAMPESSGSNGSPSTVGTASEHDSSYGGAGSMAGASQPGGTGTTGGAGTMGATSAMGGTADVSNLSDAQVAGVLQTINQGATQEAQLAQSKASMPEVKRFARDMMTTHRSVQTKENALFSRLQVTPTDSAASNQLRSDTQNQLTTLQSMKGKDFDQSFMDAQVRHHNDALDLIDRMSPNVKSSELKSELQSMRSKVDARLREAERIQQSIGQGKTNTQPQNSQPHSSPNY
jgi:putative membrane protein